MTTIAAVQAGTYLFDTPRTMAHMQKMCQQAADSGASLIVFPEAFIGGYPKGMNFGAVVGSRSPEGRNAFQQYWSSAIELPGPELEQMCEYARQVQATLVVGVIERTGGTLYCSVVFIGPDGTYLGKHRKLMPTGSERLIWGQGGRFYHASSVYFSWKGRLRYLLGELHADVPPEPVRSGY